jgi:hypothetical protein
MFIYHYHPETGEYLHITTEADEDPLEPGRFVIPAHATDKTPPYSSQEQWTVFRDGGWVVEDKPRPPAIDNQLKRAPVGGLFHDVSIKRALKGGV